MSRALELAREAEKLGEVPVGAVIVRKKEIIAEGFNRPISSNDPTAHAEIVAMRAAAQTLGSYRLNDVTLYVTLEPCAMCAGAMVHARIKRLVYACLDSRAGAVSSVFNVVNNPALNHRVQCDGAILNVECGQILKDFFQRKR
jgi:tRNA(adenine34) deaminase